MRFPGALVVLIPTLLLSSSFAAQAPSPSGSAGNVNDQVQAAYRAGAAAVASNDFKTAEVQFETVVRLMPQVEEGHSALGAVLISLGRLPAAIQELEKAVALKPSDYSAKANLALAYQETGADQKALVLFKEVEVEERQSSNASQALPPSIPVAYARALAATGQVAGAIAEMKVALAKSPQSADLHDALGSLYAQEQNWPSAAGEFHEAIQRNPQLAAAHLHLGVALLEQQNTALAFPELTLACQMSPRNSVAATELGKAYAASNEDEKAIATFRHALDLDSTSVDAKYQLARTLQHAGRNQDAIPLLREVVRVQPKNAEAVANLGVA